MMQFPFLMGPLGSAGAGLGNAGNFRSGLGDGSTYGVAYSKGQDIKFAKTTDGGSNWSLTTITTESVSAPGACSFYPITNQIFVVCWINAGNTDMKFSKSTNGGSTWSSPVTVETGNALISGKLSIYAFDSSNIYIAFPSSNGTRTIVKLAKSTDGGTNWAVTNIYDAGSGTNNSTRYPSIWVPSATVVVVFHYDFTNTDIKMSKSTDSGANWTTTTLESGTFGQHATAYVVDVNTYYVTYKNGATDIQRFAKTTDGGTNWTFSDATGSGSYQASDIFALGSDIAIIGTRGTTYRFLKSTDTGANWSESDILTSTTAVSNALFFVTSSTYVNVWEDSSSGDLKYSKSTNSGSSWAVTGGTIDTAANGAYVKFVNIPS